MQIIIGGSGSTGSSLLKNILNRHSSIVAGTETSLLCKRMLYTHWNKYKHRIPKRGLRGLKNYGFHIYNGVDLDDPMIRQSKKELKNTIQTNKDFPSFCDSFFLSDKYGQNLFWAEKTPANSFSFRYFDEYFPEARIIHMVRNPYDTIASLTGRGFTTLYAIGIYLLNTAAGLEAKEKKNCYEVRYEDLVREPQNTIKDLCAFLNTPFEPDMLQSRPDENIAITKIGDWQYDETAEIGEKSVDRFSKLSLKEQNAIMGAIDHVYINKKGKKYFNITFTDIRDICERLNYDYRPGAGDFERNTLYLQKWKDMLTRTVRLYPTHMFNYPLSIR